MKAFELPDAPRLKELKIDERALMPDSAFEDGEDSVSGLGAADWVEVALEVAEEELSPSASLRREVVNCRLGRIRRRIDC